MDAACDAAQLNSLMRMAVSRIKGVRLEHSHSSFKIVILSGILWFKVSSFLANAWLMQSPELCC